MDRQPNSIASAITDASPSGMTIDLEAIAQRQRCDLSALRVALPLLEQGYEPPFLTRYRRDEIGNISERALWELVSALRTEKQLEARRDELRAKYQEGQLEDQALLDSIADAATPRQLDRIARRIRTESGHSPPASRLAVRLLNPQEGDPADLQTLSVMVVGEEQAAAAIDGLEKVLGQYLAADSRILQAATSWMDKHNQLHILEVHDPHEGSQDAPGDEDGSDGKNMAPTSAIAESGKPEKGKAEAENAEVASGDATTSTQNLSSAAAEGPAGESGAGEETPLDSTSSESAAAPDSTATSESAVAPESSAAVATSTDAPADTDAEAAKSQSAEAATSDAATVSEGDSAVSEGETGQAAEATETPTTEADAAAATGTATTEPAATTSEAGAAEADAGSSSGDGAEKPVPDAGATAKPPKESKSKSGKAKAKEARKKISPRQRRRKWLVSVLQPLKGKSLPKSRLTAFQVVMLGRALRSQVVQCAFKYNATDFVRHLAKVAGGLNQQVSNQLSEVVIKNEAAIREALEAAWWDDLIDRAARRLISVATDSLRRQMHRQPIEARTVLSIDAVGPRTAAVAVVGVDGRVLHTEDVACQLTKAVRQQLVTRLGELVHQFHVDLIVLSNGPARRNCLVALTELLAQSEGTGLRWTLAERAGAEVYAGGPEGNRELRSVPRRFRAAVWLCQAVRTPARAMAKVEVSRLRLGSYQRELADRQLAAALEDVVTSGVSQIGVDANAADRGWLASLPGVTEAVAEVIDRTRRQNLFTSRNQLLGLEAWPDLVAQRQAAGFLRVFGSEEPLDATPIHPDDYPLAEKLMARLEIPKPPAEPPGYQAPDYTVEVKPSLEPDPEAGKPQFTELKIAAVDESKPFGVEPEAAAAGNADDAASEPIEAVAANPEENAAPEAAATETAAADAGTAEAAVAEAVSGAAEPAVTEESAVADTVEASEAATAAVESQEPDNSEAAASDPEATAGEASEANSEPASEPITTAEAEAPVEPYSHPLPEGDKVARVIKEWQVGEHRVRRIVKSLCQPFDDAGFDDHTPAATMATVPKLSELKQGDMVCGVVVGIAGFGVFVELGPDCSGLIHVSRLSEDYVEDLNEYVQIGDVVTAWVVEVDNKRRRVSLSGISPERHAALREQRRQQRPPRKGRDGRGAPAAKAGGKAPAGGGQRGGAGGRGGGRPERSGGRPAGGNRGGGGRGGRRDQRGSKGPVSYTTVTRADAPEVKITDAKRTGDEPLRSFRELMQFFKEPKEQEKADSGKKAQKKPPEPKAEQSATDKADEPKVTSADVNAAGTEQGQVAEKPVADSAVTPPAEPKAGPNGGAASPETKEQGSE